MYIAFFSLAITVLMLILSFAFKLAGKLQLTLPLVYFLLIATVLNRWASAHEKLAWGILIALIAFSVISWIISLKNYIYERQYYKNMKEDMRWQIKRAKEKGISMEDVYFDAHGDMRYSDTHEIVE